MTLRHFRLIKLLREPPWDNLAKSGGGGRKPNIYICPTEIFGSFLVDQQSYLQSSPQPPKSKPAAFSTTTRWLYCACNEDFTTSIWEHRGGYYTEKQTNVERLKQWPLGVSSDPFSSGPVTQASWISKIKQGKQRGLLQAHTRSYTLIPRIKIVMRKSAIQQLQEITPPNHFNRRLGHKEEKQRLCQSNGILQRRRWKHWWFVSFQTLTSSPFIPTKTSQNSR